HVIGGTVPRMGAEARSDLVLCQTRELVLECQNAGPSHVLLWLRRLCLCGKNFMRTRWEVWFPRPIRTSRSIQSRFRSGCWQPGGDRCLPSCQRGCPRGDRELRWAIENDVHLFLLRGNSVKQQ